MTWVHRQIVNHRRYRPVVLTQEARNASHFPVDTLHDAARWPVAKRLLHRALRRLTGHYAFYASILRRERAALIHAHFGQEGYRCLAARRKAGIPLVTTFYGLDVSALPRIPAWRRRFRRLFEEGALFLAEGPHLGERLVDLGCPPEKVRVQRLGVDLAAIPCRPVREPVEGGQVVLMCGYFNEKKGFPYGVRAFGRVADRHPDARLRIIGDGPRRGEIEAAVHELNLADRVTFLGMLAAPDYLQHLLKAHVLLHPSITASDGDTEGGAPVTLLEALASGLPVVSSRHADIPAVAPDGQCALLAPERDVEGLAERLDALLSDPDLRGRMGEAGRRHIEAHHDAVRQGERLEEMYDEAALQGARQGRGSS
jgi:colanic acid/amylovoran biosynthesis glycosyltransferase